MNLQPFYKYLRRDKTRIILFSFFTVLFAIFEGASIGLLMPALQFVENGNLTGIWSFLNTILESLGLKLSFTLILFAILGMVVLKQVAGYLQRWFETRIREDFVVRLRNEAFEKILNADMRFFHNKKTGNLIETLTAETNNSGSGLFVLIRIFSNIIIITIYLILLLIISWQMTFIAFFIVLIASVIVNYSIKKSFDYGKKLVELNNSFNDFIVERLGGIRVVKSAATEKKEMVKLNEIASNIAAFNDRFALNAQKVVSIFEMIILSAVLFIFYYSVQVLKMPIATLAVFMLVVVRMVPLAMTVNNLRNEVALHLGSFENVNRIIRESEEHTTIKSGVIPFKGLTSGIEFENVSFAYSPGNHVLNNVSISIKRGETVAIVGASGAGKSTLADLILRLHDATSGRIAIDGIDIKEYDVFNLRRGMGFVSQDVFLFNGSVSENIGYGCDGAKQSDIMNAARIAHAYDFIERLPEGYDTLLGDRGVKLSGGQRQRLALARAILHSPSILILDEATSALDSESEQMIQESLDKIRDKHTIIAIAHRLSTIENADKIVVLEKGSVVEEGTHEDLIKKGQYYANYYNLQHNIQNSNKTNGV
jgi:subfamily B ATP-binding cassette protein MsbA